MEIKTLKVSYYLFQKEENEIIKHWYLMFMPKGDSLCIEDVETYYKNMVINDFGYILEFVSKFDNKDKIMVHVKSIRKLLLEIIKRFNDLSTHHFDLYKDIEAVNNDLELNGFQSNGIKLSKNMESSDALYISLISDSLVNELELFIQNLDFQFLSDGIVKSQNRLVIPIELFKSFFAFCIAKKVIKLEDGTILNVTNAGSLLSNYFFLEDLEKNDNKEYKPSTIGKKVSLSSTDNNCDLQFQKGFNALAEVYDKELIRKF